MPDDEDELYFNADDLDDDVFLKFPNHTIEDLLEWGVLWMTERDRYNCLETEDGAFSFGQISVTKKKARLMGIIC